MVHWKKYFRRAYASFQKQSFYRLNTFFMLANSLLYLVLFYAIWSAIDRQGSIRGGLDQVMSYYVISQVIWNGAISVAPENYIGERVREGTIVNQLKRPLAIRTDSYLREMGGNTFNLLTRSIPILVLGTIVFGIPVPSIINSGAFLLSFLLSFHLVFMFAYLIAALTFWTKVSWSLQMMRVLVINILSGVLFPIYLMPSSIQEILNLLPFQSMVDGPINIYLMRATGYEIISVLGKQLVWIVLIYLISLYLWKKALKKLTVQGG